MDRFPAKVENMANLNELIAGGDVTALKAALAQDPGLALQPVEGAPSGILLAAYHGKRDLADALRNAKGTLDVFEAAALGDQHQMARILAALPRAIDEFSGDGFSPLGLAAFFGHREMVSLLLANGADPNVRSRNGLAVVPLQSALANQHKEIARDLVEAGADVNAGGEGWSPLKYCEHYGDKETAEFLIARGAKE